ncbi:MAG: hypothetical protein JNK49_15930 [Planctomycetes bacterium]|nr:hypothetical protein [Planctomycetota bacterium]
MFNCSDDVLGFHDVEVTLPLKEREEMRGRRKAVRERLKAGLEKSGKPLPIESKSQGSYAMKTMTQDPDKDYDIDDGVYFDRADLVGSRGADMSSLEARQMVRDAVDDRSFKTKPEVRPNCVRVVYDAGYHVDLPVYRRVTSKDVFGTESVYYELASVDWKRSDARDVTAWFDKENELQSPDKENGRQLRRITRLLKKFAKSRKDWKGKALGGFGITKLVVEKYSANALREDTALHSVMQAIKSRLDYDLVVKHPVTPNDTITKGRDDARARFLREKLGDALEWLKPVFDAQCDRKTAAACWDKVFNTSYFTERLKKETSASAELPTGALDGGLLKTVSATPAARDAVQKDGGGRYA